MPVIISLQELQQKILNYKLNITTAERLNKQEFEPKSYVLVRCPAATAEAKAAWKLFYIPLDESKQPQCKLVSLSDKYDETLQSDLGGCFDAIPATLMQRIRNLIQRKEVFYIKLECEKFKIEIQKQLKHELSRLAKLKAVLADIKAAPASKLIMTGTVLDEFLKNSIDAGATTLRIEIFLTEKYLKYVFTDNGRGFSQEFLKKDPRFDKSKKAGLESIVGKAFVSEKKESAKEVQMLGGQGKGLLMAVENPFGAKIHVKNELSDPRIEKRGTQIIISSPPRPEKLARGSGLFYSPKTEAEKPTKNDSDDDEIMLILPPCAKKEELPETELPGFSFGSGSSYN